MGRTKHSEKFNPFSSALRVTLSFVLMLAALATTPRANATAISNTEMDIGSVTVSVSSGSIVDFTMGGYGDGTYTQWDYATGSWDPINTTSTPEPASIALLGSGLLGVAGVLRRKLGQ